jgi:hypothetical protein
MSTTVFDVVHMFSERGISAVPIIDENGVVVNLYETVDVIVSAFARWYAIRFEPIACTDASSSRRIPSPRLDDCRSPEPTIARFSRSGDMYCIEFNRHASTID